MRRILIKKGVGPDAEPTAEDPPEDRERDWLDEILDTNAAPPAPDEPEPEQPPAAPAAKAPAANAKKRKKKRKPRDPAAPRAAFDHRPESPRQSLLDAWDRIPARLKWLGYHAGAA
jgi:hypothetical protein